MKLKLVLAFSLFANAGLLAALWLKPSGSLDEGRGKASESRNTPSASGASETGAAALAAVKAPGKNAGGLSPELWARVYSPDLRTLIANLRALGVPPRLLRAIVREELSFANFDRRAEIMKERTAIPFWASKTGSQYGYSFKLMKLDREERESAKQLLGADGLPDGEELSWMSPVPSLDLPAEKVTALQRIKADYDEMRNLSYMAANGILLPESREKLRLLEGEYRNDLASVLTPEELKEYELRNSQTATQLRSQYSAFDFTEAEFRSVFDAQSAFDEKYSSFSFLDNGSNPAKAADQKKMEEQIKAALGEERFKEFQRSKDYSYRIVAQLASEYELPKQTASGVYDLEAASKSKGQSIMTNKNLSFEERSAALEELAKDYEQKMGQLLPGKALGSYQTMAGGSFSRMIDSFRRFSVQQKGGQKAGGTQ